MIDLDYRESNRTVNIHLDDSTIVLTAEQATSFPVTISRIFSGDEQSLTNDSAGYWMQYVEDGFDYDQCNACESKPQWNAVIEGTDSGSVQTMVLCIDCTHELQAKLEKGNEEHVDMLLGDSL